VTTKTSWMRTIYSDSAQPKFVADIRAVSDGVDPTVVSPAAKYEEIYLHDYSCPKEAWGRASADISNSTMSTDPIVPLSISPRQQYTVDKLATLLANVNY
jgi:hypothetical protein